MPTGPFRGRAWNLCSGGTLLARGLSLGPPAPRVGCRAGGNWLCPKAAPFLFLGGVRGAGGGGKRPLSEAARSLPPLPERSGSETQEDVIRNVAQQLARIGDMMDHRVPPSLVNHLVMQLSDRSLSDDVSEEPPPAPVVGSPRTGRGLLCPVRHTVSSEGPDP